MNRVGSFYIGDDWVMPLILADAGGNPLNLSEFTVGGTYYAPTGTTPSSVDISSHVTIVGSISGAVTVVIPKETTSLIAALPQGRKGNLAHVQLFTTEIATGFKVTRRVVAVEPLDPASFDPRCNPADGPNYQRVSIFPFGEAL